MASNTNDSTTQKDTIMQKANAIWTNVLKTVKEIPDFKNWSDDKKISYFYKDNGEFYKEFPIVCRYMVTMGQYSPKAFSKYLDLKALDARNLPSEEKREKGYIEDRWVQREADYIMLLWQNYTKDKNMNNARAVREQAYNALKKEFSDFRDLYKQTELKIQQENKLNHKELLKEVITRMSQQPIHEPSTPEGDIKPATADIEKPEIQAYKRRLRDLIYDKVLKQRKTAVLNELKEKMATKI